MLAILEKYANGADGTSHSEDDDSYDGGYPFSRSLHNDNEEYDEDSDTSVNHNNYLEEDTEDEIEEAEELTPQGDTNANRSLLKFMTNAQHMVGFLRGH